MYCRIRGGGGVLNILALNILHCYPSLNDISFQNTGWWTYELCYGKHVAQLHFEGECRTLIGYSDNIFMFSNHFPLQCKCVIAEYFFKSHVKRYL